MAFNETLSDRIREALSEQENVIEKRMFGGICYMVNDKMCVGGIGEEMMCRVGEEAFKSAIERPGCREMDFASRPMKGYVYVSDEGMYSAYRVVAAIEGEIPAPTFGAVIDQDQQETN